MCKFDEVYIQVVKNKVVLFRRGRMCNLRKTTKNKHKLRQFEGSQQTGGKWALKSLCLVEDLADI